MSQLSKRVKNQQRKILIDKFLQKRKQLKSEGRFLELDKLPKNSSPVRYRNRCSITGNARGFMRRFGIRRTVFRELASYGYIPGVVKASW